MKVTLVDHTPDPERKIATYAAICYDSDTSDSAVQRRITKLVSSGHLSTLRFATATFLIEGISRTCSHQLVRHKFLDYLQESQRYVNQDNADYIFPESLTGNADYLKGLFDSHLIYKKLIKSGIRKEDARFILPQAAETRMYVTGNFQAWLDFITLRSEKHAQWEIRNVALEVQRQLNVIAPNIFTVKEEHAT